MELKKDSDTLGEMQTHREIQAAHQSERRDDAGPIDPDKPHWGPLIGLGVWLVSVALILLMPVLFVLPYAASQQVSVSDTNALGQFLQADKTAIVVNVISVIPAHLITLAIVWAVVTQMGRRPFFESLGNSSGGFRFVHGAGIVFGFFVLAVLLGYFVPDQENEMMKVLRSSREALILVAVIATFSAPFIEEFVYRGVLYSGFRKTAGETASIALVTVLFTLVHVPQYWPTFSAIALLLLLSLVLTIVRARTGNLKPCIVLHLIFNAFNSALLLLSAP